MSESGPKAEGRSPEVMSALARTAHVVRRDRQVGKVRLPEGPPCRARRKPGISTLRIERLGPLICPSGCLSTGVSSLISDFPKNIFVPTHPKSDLEFFASHPTRGRIMIVTDAGRGAVDAAAFCARWMAGQVGERPVSDYKASGREMLQRTAKSCGPDAPTLASSSRMFESAQPGADKTLVR
jgi:hypothetical protein